jgi:transposase-like protein
MLINDVQCPFCSQHFIVDRSLWEVGTVRLRCVSCQKYFLPADSPKSRSLQSAAGASVPILIREPDGAEPELRNSE